MSLEVICQGDISDVFVGSIQAHCENWRCGWSCTDKDDCSVQYEICDEREECFQDSNDELCVQCTVGYWKANTEQTLRHGSYVCHYTFNCLNKTFHCNKMDCPEGYSMCSNKRECIPNSKFCNGVTWQGCSDKSDEDPAFCDTWPCDEGHWKCLTSGKCIRNFLVCNRRRNCHDYSDEDESLCVNWTCAVNFWKCADDRCIQIDKICDGHSNCRDGSDEWNCKNITRPCSPGNWRCHEGTRCITERAVCNGDPLCEDGSDEDPEFCKTWTCIEAWMKCDDQTQCVAMSNFCDGDRFHCRDRSDELHCREWTCPTGQVKCGDLKQCITVSNCLHFLIAWYSPQQYSTQNKMKTQGNVLFQKYTVCNEWNPQCNDASDQLCYDPCVPDEFSGRSPMRVTFQTSF